MNTRRAHLALVLLGIGLALPSLAAGFFADDYVQIAALEKWSINPAGPAHLYSFVPPDPARLAMLRDVGALPWFTAPDLRLAFARPVSSLLMAADHALFGRHPVPYHLHTLLWYAALLAVAALLLRQIVPESAGAWGALALFIFCADDAHALTVTFIAARNATVSCVLVWLGLWAHLRWRLDGWRAGRWWAPALAALGLAAGETGLAALAYLVAWEISERRPGWRRALAPTALMIAAYFVVYRLAGLGAHGSGTYLDPFGDPGGFLRELPARLAILFGNLVLATPIDAVTFDARLRAPLIAVGCAAAIAITVWLPGALRRMDPTERALVRWMALGALGALLVGTPGILGERLLLAAGLGAAVVLAALLRDAWRLFRERRRWLPALGLAALGLPNVVAAPVALPAKIVFFDRVFAGYRRLARTAEIDAPVPARVVTVALDDLVALHLLVIRAFEQGRSAEELRTLFVQGRSASGPDNLGERGSAVLSMGSATHRLRRTAADTLELSTVDGTLLDGGWARTLRAPSRPLSRGTVVRTMDMTATVLEDRGGAPTRVAFQFTRPLDDPSWVFLTLVSGRLRRLPMPPIGGELWLPRLKPFAAALP